MLLAVNICYKLKMESWLLAKLSKSEIIILLTAIICYLRPKVQLSKIGPYLLWFILAGLVYWQIVNPDYWSSPEGFISLHRWQFCVKFCLVLHAAICWRNQSIALTRQRLFQWLIALLISMLLVLASKPSAATAACLCSYLFFLIFIPKRKNRKITMIVASIFLLALSALVWLVDTTSTFWSMLQWLPLLGLFIGLGLMGNFCKNHLDTELKDFIFYLIGLTWILSLHFCILRSVCWTSPSILIDVTVLIKIGLAWIWVLLVFHWCLPKITTTHCFSLMLPMGIVLCLFMQAPQAKTFQVLMAMIPIFFMQYWWLARSYNLHNHSDAIEPLLLTLNCGILAFFNWLIKPTVVGIWNFSPTLVTIYGLTVLVAILGLRRKPRPELKKSFRQLIYGFLIILGLSYFMTTVSNPLYLHLRDEYKESSLILEPVNSR